MSEPHFVLNTEMAELLPVWGSITLKPDDCLLLASDGIDEVSSGCPLVEVQAILEEGRRDLAQTAETLLQRCLGKNGGNDNLSFIIVTF